MAKKKAAKKKSKKKAAKKKPAAVKAGEDGSSGKQITHKRFKINYWRTKLHSEELGVYQSLKYQAKTRYFGKNFEIEGVVEEDGEKKWIIAYNKDDWKSKPDDQKRLLLRLFTIMEEGIGVEKGGNFLCGCELSITHSLIQSYEIKHPAPVFFVTMPRTKHLVKIVRGYRLTGTRWSWPLLPDDKEDMLVMVKAKGTVGLGTDYDIYIGKKKIARIDGERVQKNFEIEIYDEDYAKDKLFQRFLILFGCICNFMKEIDKQIDGLFKAMKDSGATSFKPPELNWTSLRIPD